jgi:hypothetical protein
MVAGVPVIYVSRARAYVPTGKRATIRHRAGDSMAALIVTPSPGIIDNRAARIAAALAHRVPTMHAYGFEVAEGATIAHGCGGPRSLR